MKNLTRRKLMQSALVAAPFATLATRRLSAAAPVDPITQKLADYMAAAPNRALPAEAVEKAKHHILDTFAAMVSGYDLPPGHVAHAFAKAHPGDKTCVVAASKFRCSPMEAAMVNGMLAHSDETDDSHAPSQCHPGAPTVPAALAAGEYFNVDGTRFLRAVTLGYDVGTRVTMTLGALQYQMETHRASHSIAGNFCAAAAAAACAPNLNEHHMRWILDYASQQASGIVTWQRDTEHVEKSLVFAGFGARNGVSAALLIAGGASGVEDAFFGPDNFLDAFGAKHAPAGLIEKLGERYEISRTNIKKWTVGSPIQAALDAIDNLRKKHPFEADQVKKVDVRMGGSDAKTVNDREMPDISLQHMVAVMLLDKTASFAAAHDRPRMKDPAVLKQKAKVSLIGDKELEDLKPLRISVVEITLNDGTVLKERVDDVRGTAENPMTRDEVITKARDLMNPVIGTANTQKLIAGVMEIEKVKSIRELAAYLQPA
jgi:2-methylcitrate dehydratase PrpD